MAKRRVDSSEEEEELADDNSDYTHSVTDDKPKPKPSRTRAQQVELFGYFPALWLIYTGIEVQKSKR